MSAQACPVAPVPRASPRSQRCHPGCPGPALGSAHTPGRDYYSLEFASAIIKFGAGSISLEAPPHDRCRLVVRRPTGLRIQPQAEFGYCRGGGPRTRLGEDASSPVGTGQTRGNPAGHGPATRPARSLFAETVLCLRCGRFHRAVTTHAMADSLGVRWSVVADRDSRTLNWSPVALPKNRFRRRLRGPSLIHRSLSALACLDETCLAANLFHY